MLSEYLPALEGTYGDTTVYVMEGEKEGASMLVLGGTHPNEPTGQNLSGNETRPGTPFIKFAQHLYESRYNIIK